MICTLIGCTNDTQAGACLCSPCVEHLRDLLRDIDMYLRVVTPQRPTLASGPGSAGYESRSPAVDHVIVMLDPRSKANGHQAETGAGRIDRPDDLDHPIVSVPGVLGEWAERTWQESTTPHERRVHRAPVDVGEAITLLITGAPWIARQTWADALVDELRTVRRQLANAAHDEPPPVIAECTKDQAGRRCGGPVREVPATDTRPGGARCSTCKTRYTGATLVRLQLAQVSP